MILPEPFHVYSMRQAIEEGFILDVLKNYTPYKLAFKVAHDGKEIAPTGISRLGCGVGCWRFCWARTVV